MITFDRSIQLPPMTPFTTSQFWETRYGQPDFAYGTEPNEYLKTVLAGLLPGRLLLPAEGEGRNAVYAAQLGWQVNAFDFSAEGRRKAESLAAEQSVSINYTLADLLIFTTDTRYDTLALIFVHLNPAGRHRLLTEYPKFLKPGGKLILEGFSPAQIGKPSGGPNAAEFCYTSGELRATLTGGLVIEELVETEYELAEGAYHQGRANTVRLLATKI
jgi:SAM-dependent methyltransferase